MIPFEMSFGQFVTGGFVLSMIDNFIDTMFFIDLQIMFFTSYIDKLGTNIIDSRMIAKNYIKTIRFYMDVLALLGIGFFVNLNSSFKFFQLLKIFRVFRVGEIVAKSNSSQTTKAAMNLFKIIFYLMMYLHVLACFWHLTIYYNAPDAFFIQEDGSYMDSAGILFNNTDGTTEIVNDISTANFIRFDHNPVTFGMQKSWHRLTSSDDYSYGLGWEDFNQRWEARRSQWFTTVEWMNIAESTLFSKENWKKVERYHLM